MNRKNKIIVSIVGISIISLALIGLTYGYYLTRIQGNTNNKSISISTANLELTYSDNSDVITGTNIVPGTTLPTKTFTVTNSGNNNVDSYSVGLVNVINTFTRLDDIKYKVTCSSSVTGKTCNGISESTFPNENSYIIENQIDSKEVQTYIIEVEYKEMNVDQSDDMGKTLEAKIDIFDTKALTIQGTVTNYSEDDYVVINSKEQTSEIVDGKYKFIGIEPDTHKITIKNKETTSTKQTTLNVSKGEPSASGSNITYNDEKNIADADITITGDTVTINVSKIYAGDTTLPNDAVITFNIEYPQITNTITALISQSDDNEINVTNSKWLINRESTELKDKNGYTWTSFKSNPETINITQTVPGLYYLHILSVDSNNNKKETIKMINIFPEYDESLNDNRDITESGTIWTNGDGTAKNPYLIETAENLEYLSYKVNTGEKYTGKYFALTTTLDVSDLRNFIPIGNRPGYYFDGTFEGGGQSITNLVAFGCNITVSGKFTSCDGENNYNFVGLFGITGPNSAINGVSCDSCVFGNMSDYDKNDILSNNFVGFIGYNMGELNYNGALNGGLYGNLYVGGIAGFNAGSIIASTSMNNEFFINDYAGGIAGYNTGSVDENGSVVTNATFEKYTGSNYGNTIGYDATK